MELRAQSLKELYEKDFYLWLLENLRLLKNRELDLVDWENLVEEIEDMGKSLFKSVRSYISRSPKVYKTAHILCSRPLTWKGGTNPASHPYPIP
jgi:hypothetical protein